MDAGKQILKWVLITLISFTTFNLFISSKYTVEREELINVPPNFVYSEVVDLHKWKYWSVWIKEDTTITVEYSYNNIGEIDVPLIVRLQGTNASEAKQLIDESGLEVHSVILLQEAADKVAEVLS